MRKYLNQKNFYGGIAPSEKIGTTGSFAFGKSLNIFDEPTQISILPKTVKVSGSTVTDLIKWIVSGKPHDTNMYFYSEGGKIYKETSGGTWSALQTTANSYGQGMEIFDDYLYYTQNTQLGRYGPLSGSPTFTDNYKTGLNDTSTTKFAPIKAFRGGLAVGHGNKLAFLDDSLVWVLVTLTLPAGLQIRTLDVVDEFLVIGTWRGTAITDNEEGRLYFWDGTSTTYNYFVSCPGGVNAVVNSKNRPLSIMGSSGEIYMNYRPFNKLHRIPGVNLKGYVEVFPGAVTNWQGLTMIGVGGNTDSATVDQGVYAWGSKSDLYPECLNFSFPISTGVTESTGVRIGAVYGVGNYLYIAWKAASVYGIDKVTNSGNPYGSAILEQLIFDNEQLYTEKQALVIKAKHLPLLTNESIQLGYKKNRADDYTTDTANSTVGSTETRFIVPEADARFDEFQIECILISSLTTSPTVTYLGMEFEDLREEELGY